MGKETIIVYPRGFLGYDIGLPVINENNDITKLIAAIRQNKPLAKGSNNLVVNNVIDNLWRQFNQGNRFIKSFAFRQQILEAALTAFGTTSFLEWCELQNDSPYLTEMHKRFLNDTFNFISTGERSINLLNWMSLIKLRELSSSDDSPEYRYADFFDLNQPIHFRREITVKSNIQTWVARRNGFVDLLQTLHILFGNQGNS